MLTEPKCVFALVRSMADLDRACADLAGFLPMRRRSSPAARAETMLGIWIDAQCATGQPYELGLQEASGGRRTARVVEATGISGIWMLCWLDVCAREISRADLLGALLERSGHERVDAARGRFIPVFPQDVRESNAEAEMERLGSRYPGLLLAPLYQDSRTALLEPLSECIAPAWELH